MIDWLRGKLGAPYRAVSALAAATLAAVLAPWHVFTGFLHLMRLAVSEYIAALVNFLKLAQNFAYWSTNALRDILINRIPQTLRHALDTSIGWAKKFAQAALDHALGALNTIFWWTVRKTDEIIGTLSRVRDYLLGLISPVVVWLSRVGNRVADIVLHPEKLALWVIPALWGPLWRYLQANAVTIGRWLLARSAGTVVASASLIESVIVKIL